MRFHSQIAFRLAKHQGSGQIMTCYVLTLICQNRPGIVAAVAGFLAEGAGNIVEAQQFDDQTTGLFFMRVRFDHSATETELRRGFQVVAGRIDMDWDIRRNDYQSKVLILVSKFDHCLGDLLYRQRIGELNMVVVAVVSNHSKDALNFAVDEHIPFHHFPITKATKQSQEVQIRALIEETGAELVVLARYMQILSSEMSAFLAGRCINIHHSFLPGFKGAKPYHQAHDRGVKMIGATGHYMTDDLDEGPIIVQDVEHVSHAHTPEDFVAKGRNIEQRVLAQAVALHLDRRVLINGSKTVVFRK